MSAIAFGPNPDPSPNPQQIFAPNHDCMFNPDLPKCIPPEGGSCPNGFGMNEDGQCFPDTECPSGHARMDDDKSDACIPFNTIDYGDGCPPESANPED